MYIYYIYKAKLLHTYKNSMNFSFLRYNRTIEMPVNFCPMHIKI